MKDDDRDFIMLFVVPYFLFMFSLAHFVGYLNAIYGTNIMITLAIMMNYMRRSW